MHLKFWATRLHENLWTAQPSMYLGEISAMSQVHDTHPDKDVYFTEQWTSGDGEFEGRFKMAHVQSYDWRAT